nr:integrase, catalytic region, zinc finger, CCHC-type, peptidase aspartic, catalytic [Tanacetum cinerariifolium]
MANQQPWEPTGINSPFYMSRFHYRSQGANRLFGPRLVRCPVGLFDDENGKNTRDYNDESDDNDEIDNEKLCAYELSRLSNHFEIKNKELNEQLKVLIEKNDDLLAQTKVLKDQLQVKHVVIDTHVGCKEKYAKLEAERYEYMIRYSAYFDNDKQHKKQIADQEVLYDKMTVQLVELDKHIINPDFEKIDSLFQQTSSLKPYVPTLILEKIIIDLEDEVVSLLEKEKANLETIESLKSKDTFSSVRRPKHNGVIWKKKVSSNTSNVELSSVSHSKLNKHVKRYFCKDLLSCNNSHLGETSSAYVCNDVMNVSCNSRLCDSFDENNLFIFDDESVRIYPIIKMSFRKKPRDSMNIVQICLWIIDSGCSNHMAINRAMFTNFVEKFLGTVRFGKNDFTVIAGYEDVVIGSMTIKKVYYVEGLRHNLFSVGQFCDKGLEVAFRKSTCFVRNEDGIDLLIGDRSSNLYTIAL